MSIPIKAMESMEGYCSGPFGYQDITMNARFTNNVTTYNPAGTSYTPPVNSRNNEQWKQVETNSDYTYDGTMIFPIPCHRLKNVTIEVEIMTDGLYRPPTSNSAVILRVEMVKKVNDNWTNVDARQVSEGILPNVEGQTGLRRMLSSAKFFYNYSSGQEPVQMAIRPVIKYDGNEFRIDNAFVSVKLLANSTS